MKKLASLALAVGLAAPALGHYNNSASRVLPTTRYVENASYALGSEDGRFAEIYYQGSLELELEEMVKDAKGAELKIASRVQVEEREPGTQVYEVWAKKDLLDSWTRVGVEKPGFALGESYTRTVDISPLEEAKFVKIVYQNPYFHTAVPRIERNVIGIDSVESKF